ncbi:hypothetical protein [Pseudovibrio sp. Ad37]|uniref:hypothetical protein n=1 Tax=Pseudovibrio sp. Ad37 TaxID=989422 RepID=UPI0007AE4795|nr:hypothetical protein [Pseudovibrio sp. Ad37]KZL23583.1 hypothetical protein PsAD37_03097 [Pseudovibrio sp. Ad37]
MIYFFIIFGAAFGLIAVPLGFFIGLQVSPILANILLFPFITASWLLDVPLGEMSGLLRICLTVLSSIIWAGLFGFAGSLLKKKPS